MFSLFVQMQLTFDFLCAQSRVFGTVCPSVGKKSGDARAETLFSRAFSGYASIAKNPGLPKSSLTENTEAEVQQETQCTQQHNERLTPPPPF